MKDTVKDIVIQILLEKKGMSLTEIRKYASATVSKKYSYHSYYKALQQLTEEGAINKTKGEYILTPKWIESKIEFLNQLKTYQSDLSDECKVHKFSDIKDLYKFLRKLEDEHLDIFDHTKEGSVLWVVYHCYNYLLHPAKELGYLKKLKENNVDLKILCYGDTALDKWTKRSLEKYGAQMKTSANVGGLIGLNIYDDVVVMIYYGKAFLDVLNGVYSSTRNMDDFCIGELYDKLDNIDYTITAMVSKDKDIIESLKERALSHF
jgi:DNA-binding PadR family transcriptional regulator